MVFKVENPAEHRLQLRLDTNVRVQEEDIGTTPVTYIGVELDANMEVSCGKDADKT